MELVPSLTMAHSTAKLFFFFSSNDLSLLFRHCIHFLSSALDKHGFPTTLGQSSSPFLFCFTTSSSVAFLTK